MVQLLIGLKIPVVTKHLLAQLEKNYTTLSFNKFGSNVVEKCLYKSAKWQASNIIWELMQNKKFSLLLLDEFGNYVIQSALSVSKVISLFFFPFYVIQYIEKMLCLFNQVIFMIKIYFIFTLLQFANISFKPDFD